MLADSSPMAAITATEAPASGGDRRLFRRYPSGLAAELVLPDGATPCRIGDISLGGASVELREGETPPAPGATLRLRSPHMASGHGFPAEVRQVAGARVHLAFRLDDYDDYELTMFLMDNRATYASGAAER